jgi:hypothetical protein
VPNLDVAGFRNQEDPWDQPMKGPHRRIQMRRLA